MATIVFAMLPEAGHLNPTLKIAKALKSRGHQVKYVCTPNLKDLVLSNGLDFIPAFEKLYQDKDSPLYPFIGLASGSIEQAVKALREREGNIQPVLDIVLRESRELFTKIRPDLLVTDSYVAYVAAVAKMMGIQSLLLNTNLFDPWEDIKKDAAAMGIAEIVLCPREFDFPRPDLNRHSHYVEASIDLERAEIEFPWHLVSRDKPLVFCSLGSQSYLYERGKYLMDTVISALAVKPHMQLVLATGQMFGPVDFQPIPPNVLLLKAAPQLGVLKRASIMITHGGLNSIKEAIFFGVPMIVFPFVHDQHSNAARVVYHGLGLDANAESITVEQMGALIDRVVGDGAFRTRMDLMAARFRELEERGQAVRFIEAVLSNQQDRPAQVDGTRGGVALKPRL